VFSTEGHARIIYGGEGEKRNFMTAQSS